MKTLFRCLPPPMNPSTSLGSKTRTDRQGTWPTARLLHRLHPPRTDLCRMH